MQSYLKVPSNFVILNFFSSIWFIVYTFKQYRNARHSVLTILLFNTTSWCECLGFIVFPIRYLVLFVFHLPFKTIIEILVWEIMLYVLVFMCTVLFFLLISIFNVIVFFFFGLVIAFVPCFHVLAMYFDYDIPALRSCLPLLFCVFGDIEKIFSLQWSMNSISYCIFFIKNLNCNDSCVIYWKYVMSLIKKIHHSITRL